MPVRSITLAQIRRTAVLLALLILAIGVGYWYGQHRIKVSLSRSRPVEVEIINRAVPPQRQVNFALFWQVWEELETSYLYPDRIDEEKMVYGAISGMTAALGDPYTTFLAPDENRQNKENLSGTFYGIGIQIGYKDRQLTVIAPLTDSPAKRAGIKPGDFILRISDAGKGIDRDTQGMPLPEAVSLIRGDRGTTVTLKLLREGAQEPFEVPVQREEIIIPSVELVFVPDGLPGGSQVAHLKLMQFGERTKKEWDVAVDRILSQRGTLSGIVLDMRDNPGGFLSGAIEITGDFVANGTVVVQQGKSRSETFNADGNGRLLEIPVIVLVNGGSASASEIVAGALRDRRGVPLVGETTFGKGTVQEAKDLPGGGGLHVTTSKWILPSGTEIGESGLVPDKQVELVEEPEGEAEIDEQLEKALEAIGGK